LRIGGDLRIDHLHPKAHHGEVVLAERIKADFFNFRMAVKLLRRHQNGLLGVRQAAVSSKGQIPRGAVMASQFSASYCSHVSHKYDLTFISFTCLYWIITSQPATLLRARCQLLSVCGQTWKSPSPILPYESEG
jgi:hypothetical protein